MSHLNVERFIGRLLTDEGCRRAFLSEPERVLRDLVRAGVELSDDEIAGLLHTDVSVWREAADIIDPRLQKADLMKKSSPPR